MKNVLILFLIICPFVADCQDFDLKSLKKTAKKGDAISQMKLGIVYLEDYAAAGIEKDVELGLEWLKRSGEQGNEKAIFRICKYYGEKTKPGKEGITWFIKGVELGDTSLVEKVWIHYYYNATGSEVEVKWLKKHVELTGCHCGDRTEPCWNLGYRYESGKGIGKNINTAIAFYQKGADCGSTACMVALGELYAYDLFLEDTQLAFDWYLKAAKKGNRDGEYAIGYRYLTGSVVEKDEKVGADWIKKAMDQGHSNAKELWENENLQQYFEDTIEVNINE